MPENKKKKIKKVTYCCCLLLKQVIDSHQFKPTDVFTGNHINNTNAIKNTE